MTIAGARSKPLNVLVVTPLGPRGRGGIDRLMDAIGDELAASPVPDLECRFVTSRGDGALIASPPRMLGCMAAMVWLRATGRLDVLHVNMASHGSTWRKMALIRLSRWLGVPYVVHLHGPEFHDYWRSRSPTARRRIADAFERAARTIVLGRFWRALVESEAPAAGPRIVVLPNGVRAPANPTLPDPDAPTILMLGQLGVRKGLPVLVEALGKLAARPAWRAVLAGDGPADALRRELEASGLASRVSAPGWVAAPEVDRLLSTSDILVLPSLHEGLPLSVIEGMAHGLAVVSTPVGATAEIVEHGVTGLLVPPGDASALAGALMRLLDDVDLRRRLGAAARAYHARELDLEPYVRRLVQVWRAAATPGS